MTKTLTHLSWYLERKWKQSWLLCCHPHHGASRTAAVAAKLGTFIVLILFLWLVYISVWAATVDISGDPGVLAYVDNNELPGFPATGSATLQHQSTESEAIPFKTVISFESSSLPKGTKPNGTFITLSLPQFTRIERIFYRYVRSHVIMPKPTKYTHLF